MATSRNGRRLTALAAVSVLVLLASFATRAQQSPISLESVLAPLDGQSVVVDEACSQIF